jgi:hypothetical protein
MDSPGPAWLSTQPEQMNTEVFVDAFAAMDAIAATLT